MSEFEKRKLALELALQIKNDDATIGTAEAVFSFLTKPDADEALLRSIPASPAPRDITKGTIAELAATGKYDGTEYDVMVIEGGGRRSTKIALPENQEVRYLDEADKSDPLNQLRSLVFAIDEHRTVSVTISDRRALTEFPSEREAMEQMVRALLAHMLAEAREQTLSELLAYLTEGKGNAGERAKADNGSSGATGHTAER
jgi:hypothetical protein